MAALIKTNLLSRINVDGVSVGHFANGLYFDVRNMFKRGSDMIYVGNVYNAESKFMFRAEVNDETGEMTAIHEVPGFRVEKACHHAARIARGACPPSATKSPMLFAVTQ